MALAMNSMVFCMALVALFGGCFGAVYQVGDSNVGWTVVKGDKAYYKNWASSKRFFVGDTIIFEYNPKMDNVIQVGSHASFNGCNKTDTLSFSDSGNDRIELKKAGHHFYIGQHCEAGQKVDINVFPSSQGPSPSPSPSSSPATPEASISSPNKGSAAPSIQSSSGLLMLVLTAVGVLAHLA